MMKQTVNAMKFLRRFATGIALILALLLIPPVSFASGINLFACEPEWAALASELGGDRVMVTLATTAQQDPHYIRARPSLMAKIRKADLVICTGADLEAGWLPLLLERANSSVQPGQTGNLMASDFVPLLDKPVKADRSQGDIHMAGNPHLHTNPHNILLVAKELNQRLQILDPDHRELYQQGFSDFTLRWEKAIATWEALAAGLKHRRVIAHHESWAYLIAWLGLEKIGILEPKPGLPPTIHHLESLLETARATPVLAIVRTPYDPAAPSEWLAEKAKIPALTLPFTVGGSPGAKDLRSLFQETLDLLLSAQKS